MSFHHVLRYKCYLGGAVSSLTSLVTEFFLISIFIVPQQPTAFPNIQLIASISFPFTLIKYWFFLQKFLYRLLIRTTLLLNLLLWISKILFFFDHPNNMFTLLFLLLWKTATYQVPRIYNHLLDFPPGCTKRVYLMHDHLYPWKNSVSVPVVSLPLKQPHHWPLYNK